MEFKDLNTREGTAFFYYLVLIAGVLFYLGWGLLYHSRTDGAVWTDIGVYSVTVLLIGFGLIGTWLYQQNFHAERD